ncbi:unnamed protein product [Prorocentrum cordatum]|uniref:Uncharacterized protein n=1 Tax=Prorocentrum cordatum TaxID=2364126 RepID=A0ABN9VBP7_9DINO|nr:unnamed protein product [Polarella glacialis]
MGRGSENRAVVYMPGCAAGLLYSGPEQVPKRNTASRPRLASSLGRTRSTGLGETEGRGPDLGFGCAEEGGRKRWASASWPEA